MSAVNVVFRWWQIDFIFNFSSNETLILFSITIMYYKNTQYIFNGPRPFKVRSLGELSLIVFDTFYNFFLTFVNGLISIQIILVSGNYCMNMIWHVILSRTPFTPPICVYSACNVWNLLQAIGRYNELTSRKNFIFC